MSKQKSTHCSPARYGSKATTLDATGTCLTKDEIVEAAQATIGLMDGGRFDARTLVKRVHEALGTALGEEGKWAEAPQIARSTLGRKIEKAYRPEHPLEWVKDSHYWLSNFDIDAVMRQYQEASPSFRFVGVFPRDFSAPLGATTKGKASKVCVAEALCNLSIAEEKSKGYDEAGFVLNLDTHRGPGTHWTGCYIGMDPVNKPHRFGFFYYDSVGRQPPKEIREFSSRLAKEASAVFLRAKVPFRVAHNTVRKQFEDSECGIYSMFFIVSMVQTDLTFDEICRDVIKRDGAMHGLRRVFFRPP